MFGTEFVDESYDEDDVDKFTEDQRMDAHSKVLDLMKEMFDDSILPESFDDLDILPDQSPDLIPYNLDVQMQELKKRKRQSYVGAKSLGDVYKSQ